MGWPCGLFIVTWTWGKVTKKHSQEYCQSIHYFLINYPQTIVHRFAYIQYSQDDLESLRPLNASNLANGLWGPKSLQTNKEEQTNVTRMFHSEQSFSSGFILEKGNSDMYNIQNLRLFLHSEIGRNLPPYVVNIWQKYQLFGSYHVLIFL